MNDIELLRKQIDAIDQEMKNLFIQRMDLVAKVAFWKSKNNYPIFDPIREKQMIENNVNSLENQDLSRYYEDFLKSILKLSKDYQISLIARGNL